MAYQPVGVGVAANDGLGDQLRPAMQKVNANFVELYAADTALATLISDETTDRAAAISAEATARANADTALSTAISNETAARIAADLAIPVQGMCELTTNGTLLTLQRKGGNQVFINGAQCTIPSAGVTLPATGLTPGTTYYIYAYMDAGTMTLEASTTGYSADTTYGHMIKTGDATRILVGACVPQAGPVFADNMIARLTRTWYHDKGINLMSTTIVETAMGSGPFTEISSTMRTNALLWAREKVNVVGNASCYDPGAITAFTMYLAIGRNGANVGRNGVVSPRDSLFFAMSAIYAAEEGSDVNVQYTLLGGISGGSSPRYMAGYTGYVVQSSGNGG